MTGAIVYYNKNLQKALTDLFPNIGWDLSKFRITPAMGTFVRSVLHLYFSLNLCSVQKRNARRAKAEEMVFGFCSR
jgi:hypothetical protein